jgi:hypothetical protein
MQKRLWTPHSWERELFISLKDMQMYPTFYYLLQMNSVPTVLQTTYVHFRWQSFEGGFFLSFGGTGGLNSGPHT